METTGRIFNIAHYTVHDGPGIRTTVFFKGCPGRCLWCCSPESQSFDVEDCKACGGKVWGRDVSVGELFAEIRRDEPFWRRSGGGVTLSGGEVLAQPDFVVEFLTLCRSRYVHTAVESCLFAPLDTLRRVADVTDYFQFDLKAMDPALHLKLTSLDNSGILGNAAWLLESDMNLLVRFPLVPGVNDLRENIDALGKFVSSHRRGASVEVLRYHRLGVGTYAELGREYALPDVESPTEKELENAVNILKNYPLDVIHS